MRPSLCKPVIYLSIPYGWDNFSLFGNQNELAKLAKNTSFANLKTWPKLIICGNKLFFIMNFNFCVLSKVPVTKLIKLFSSPGSQLTLFELKCQSLFWLLIGYKDLLFFQHIPCSPYI